MKKIILLLCLASMLSCCSCGLFGARKYVCEVENVDSIQIVRLDQYIEEELRYEYTVLSQIVDYEAFVCELNEVEHSVNWGDPRQMDIGYVVIKINYINGDLICFIRMHNVFIDQEKINMVISFSMMQLLIC
ncbi:MAG: hypothetical protein E7650_00265 [Ruminococcaceae bacterium]|nr:hypothetical protein [Oscillospiraceae bacterium]